MATLLADIRTRRTLTILARRAPAGIAAGSRRVPGAVLEAGTGAIPADARRPDVGGAFRCATNWLDGAARADRHRRGGGAAVADRRRPISPGSRPRTLYRRATSWRCAPRLARRDRAYSSSNSSTAWCSRAVGSMAGIGIAYALIRVVGRYQQFFLSRLAPIELDAVTVLAGLGAGLAIGLIAAMLPRSVVSAAPTDVLRSSRGSAGDVKVTATRTALVVAQVAIALVLLVGAGLVDPHRAASLATRAGFQQRRPDVVSGQPPGPQVPGRPRRNCSSSAR